MAKASDGLGLLIAAPADDEEMPEEGADEAAVMAAEGVLKAISRKDASALYRALEEVFQHCKAADEDAYEDDEEDVEEEI